jgi:hypothetical protein
MATKNFWIRRVVSSWSRDAGNELLVTARNANPCRAANANDYKVKYVNFFEGNPEGRNFPEDVRVIYNVPSDEYARIVKLTEDGSAYLCLEFNRKTLTKVFVYDKDTGE